MKYTFKFNSGLCLDSYELMCFKIGVMLDMTKRYSLVPVCMTLIFSQGHKVTGRLEFVQFFCSNV